MRTLKLLLAWTTAIALAVTIHSYGQVKYYWYGNDQGRGYALRTWQGESLDNTGGYAQGYTYRYETYRFEKDPERRMITMILLLGTAGVLTIRILKRDRKTADVAGKSETSD